MNRIIEDLGNWGCDINGALERMLNDEEFYIDCLNALISDNSFEELPKYIKEQDAKSAFDSAHSLKGVLANLGLTPMYEKAVEIVEPLRFGNCENLLKKADELNALKEKLVSILK